MRKTIDLNADLGELPGEPGRASDRAILQHVTSCAIACGGHAGDAETMKETLLAAKRFDVAAGAHPSYPDRENFGRASMKLPKAELRLSLESQMRDLQSIAAGQDIPLRHVKPHGALYNDASRDEQTADVVASAVHSVFGVSLPIICQPGFAMSAVAEREGLPVIHEAFIDRAYRADGALVPRTEPGAVLESDEERLAQARKIVLDGLVLAAGGRQVGLAVRTLCIHGDSPGAADTARLVRKGLEVEDVIVRPPILQ